MSLLRKWVMAQANDPASYLLPGGSGFMVSVGSGALERADQNPAAPQHRPIDRPMKRRREPPPILPRLLEGVEGCGDGC